MASLCLSVSVCVFALCAITVAGRTFYPTLMKLGMLEPETKDPAVRGQNPISSSIIFTPFYSKMAPPVCIFNGSVETLL